MYTINHRSECPKRIYIIKTPPVSQPQLQKIKQHQKHHPQNLINQRNQTAKNRDTKTAAAAQKTTTTYGYRL